MAKKKLLQALPLAWLLVWGIGTSLPGFAQTTTALLTGRSRDSSGAALPGVAIEATDQNNQRKWTAITDQEGFYRIPGMPAGSYQVRASLARFETLVVTGVELSVGRAALLDLRLHPAGTQEETTVEFRVAMLDPESSSASFAVGQHQIQNLPSNGRSFLDFALLSSGTSDSHTQVTKRPVQAPTSGLSFAGQDQRSNLVTIDGLNNLDDIANSVRPTLSQEAVSEFQVKSGPFSADTGRARGGTVNVVSKSGGDRFHGSGFFFLRNEALDARNAFAPAGTDPEFERYQLGGTLGGPLVAGKTHFFASYEGLVRDESLFVNFLDNPSIFGLTPSQAELFDFFQNSGVPSLGFLAAAFADPRGGALRTLPSNFPATLELFQNESGSFPFQADTHILSFKLDQQWSAKNHSFIRVGYADSFNDNTDFGALEGVSNGVNYDIEDLSLSASDTHFFSSRTLNEFKFLYGWRNLAVRTNDPVGPEVVLAGVAEFGREFFNPTTYEINQFQWLDHFTWLRGNHDLKAGIDLEHRQRKGTAEVFLGGQFAFGEAIPLGVIFDTLLGPGTAAGLGRQLAQPAGSGGLGRPDLIPNLEAPISAVQSFNFGLPLTYFQGFGDPTTDIPVTRLGFFLQDRWQLHPDFHLNLGVRFDTSWRSETLNLVNASPPFQFDRFSRNDHSNWAPRIGFAWNLSADHRFVMRAGYGLYYQDLYGALEVTSQVLSGRISQVFLPLTGLPGVPTTSADVWRFVQETGQSGRQALDHFGISPGNTPSIILPGDPTASNPYSHQASLMLERQLARDWAVEAGYELNRGLKLIRSHDFNARPVGPNQFAIPGVDPRFIQVPVIETSGRSAYHGFFANLRKRLGNGYSLGLSYSLGKSIDDTTDFIIELGPNDPTNLNAEKALSSFDERQRIVFHGIFQLPSPGPRRSWVAALFSDWTLSPIWVWAGGKPFNLLNGFDRNGDTNEDTDRPLLVDGSQVGRNTGRGPDYLSLDTRLSRTLSWDGDGKVEILLEAFNLLNRVNYGAVNNVVGTLSLSSSDVTGSSRIPANQPLGFTSARSARQIQFGIRFSF